MKREEKIITESGSYEYGDNYEIICKDYTLSSLDNCNITCGNNCKIHGGVFFNINCRNNCEIYCWYNCNITCGYDCEIYCGMCCYIKAGKKTQLKPHGILKKTITKNEEDIWWFISTNTNIINTYKDINWQRSNPDKLKELYPIFTNELDSATLF